MARSNINRPRKELKPGSVIKYVLLSLAVFLIVRVFIGLIVPFLRGFQDGALNGVLSLFGASAQGSEAGERKSNEEIEAYLKRNNLNPTTRHHDWANQFQDLFSEGRPFAAFFTMRLTKGRSEKVTDLLTQIANQYSFINNDGVFEPTPVLQTELARLYGAYGTREVANRDIPLIGMLFKNTRDTLPNHLRRFIADFTYEGQYKEFHGVKYTGNDLATFFSNNDILNKSE